METLTLLPSQSYLFLSLAAFCPELPASPDPGDSCHFRDPAIFSPDIWTAIDMLYLDEEAEYGKRMLYLLNQAKDFGAAKDIRIFGLRTWLEEL